MEPPFTHQLIDRTKLDTPRNAAETSYKNNMSQKKLEPIKHTREQKSFAFKELLANERIFYRSNSKETHQKKNN